MTTAVFDSLRAARDIEAAGLERAQAEAIADAIRQRHENSAKNADISALRGDVAVIKDDIAGLKGRVAVIEVDIAGLKDSVARLEMSINQLRNWFVSGLVTILVAIIATALLPG